MPLSWNVEPKTNSQPNLGSPDQPSNENVTVRSSPSGLSSAISIMTDELVPDTWEQALALIQREVSEAIDIRYRGRPDKDEYLDELELFLESEYLPAMAVSAIALTGDPLVELDRICRLVISKQHDYGTRNILRYGHDGIKVRISDKIERVRNLRSKPDGAARNESLSDSWDDIVGYGLVGLMLGLGWFTLPLEGDNA